MSKIFLNDILRLTDEQLSFSKVKFNKWNGENDPLALWLADPDEINCYWLFWNKSKRRYKVGQLALCFIRMNADDRWLLTTIKKVIKDLDKLNGLGYEGEELEEYQSYFGRLIVKWRNSKSIAMANPLKLDSIIGELEVLEILPHNYEGIEFPGFENICLSYSELENIIHRQKKDWMAALSHQKAVYLITDTKTGDQYVGSATGDNGMLLQRWAQYIDDGHGGNKKLREICDDKKRGFDYIRRYFQYSVLENYNSRIDDEKILGRESWWKEVLGSRAFGLNCN